MDGAWEAWRGVSAGIAVALVVLLIVRYVFETSLSRRQRRALDLFAAPLLALFLLYISSDFLRGLP